MALWQTIQQFQPVVGAPVELFPGEEDDGQNLGCNVEISPHGEFIAACVWGDGITRFWNRGPDNSYNEIACAVPPVNAILHLNGRPEAEFMAGSAADTKIYTIDIAKGTCHKLFESGDEHGYVMALQNSPSGRLCLTKWWTWNVSVHDLLSLECLWSGVADNGHFIISDEYFATEVSRWLRDDGVEEDFSGFGDPDEGRQQVVDVGADLRVHKLPDGEVVRRISRPREIATKAFSICFFFTPKVVVYEDSLADADDRIRLMCCDVEDGSERAIVTAPLSVAVKFDDRYILAGTEQGELVLIDFATGDIEPLQTGLKPKQRIHSIAANREGRVVFCSRDGVMAVGDVR